MKNTLVKETETLKTTSDNVANQIKENVKTLIDSNSKQVNAALDANSKTFNAISKMLYDHEVDPSVVSNYKSTLIKGLELSEDTINTIIDANTKRVNQSVEFTNKFVDILKGQDLNTDEGMEKLTNLVKENMSKSADISSDSMKKIADVYNSHLNLALNFNKKFADVVNAQIEAIMKLQHKSFNPAELANAWWKKDITKATNGTTKTTEKVKA